MLKDAQRHGTKSGLLDVFINKRMGRPARDVLSNTPVPFIIS